MFHVKQPDFLTIKTGSQVFVSIRKYFKNYPSYTLASVQDSVQDNVQDNVQDKKAKDITSNNFLPLYSSLIQALPQQVVNKLLIMWIS